MGNIEDPLFVQEEVPIRNVLAAKLRTETITGYTFEIEKGVQAASGFKSFVLTFSHPGKRSHQLQYNRQGKIIQEWVYDSEGRLLREIAYHVSGKINFRFEYLYDQGENWSEKLMYLSGGELLYRIVPSRDAQGRIIEGIYTNSSGQKIRMDIYLYDDCGRLVKMSMEQMGEWTYEYDDYNNLKRKSGHLPSASVLGEDFEFHYDNRGLLIRMAHLHYSVTTFEYTLFG